MALMGKLGRGAHAALQLLCLWGALSALLGACGGDESGATEVLLSIDARDGARDAELLRVQVNAAVVQVERKSWPVELLVKPKGGDASRKFTVRAFGLKGDQLVGAAEASGSFRKGQRKPLALELDPETQLGPVPDVNSEVDPDGVVQQPEGDDGDGEGAPDGDDGDGSSSGDADAGDGGLEPAGDAGLDGGAPGCDGGSCVDAGNVDACVPSPDDCGGCGVTCDEGKQCLVGKCEDIPPADCMSFEYAGSAYLVCTDARNWTSARTACRDAGMDLVVIGSQAENEFVHGIAGANAWIGAHDRGANGTNCTKAKDEGTWYWVEPNSGDERGQQFCAFASDTAKTCTPLGASYTAWGADQPDNATCECGLLPPLLGQCTEGDDCGAISASDGSWYDVACASANRYICESKPPVDP